MSLKLLFAAGLTAALAGCTCGGDRSGAPGGEPRAVAPPAESETEPVPGIPEMSPRVRAPEEVLLSAGGSPRQKREFTYPVTGTTHFDVTFDLAEGTGDDIERHAQLALVARARIEAALPRDGVRWSLEITEASANDTEGVDAEAVATARRLAPGLVGARAIIENDRRGRWIDTTIERGTPSGRRAMATLLDAVETLRGLGYSAALGEQAEWGHRDVRRWEGIETGQKTQYKITRLEDREFDFTISMSRSATEIPAPGGGTVETLVAQGGGRGTVRFDRVMPTGRVALATTALIDPARAPTTAAGDATAGDGDAAPSDDDVASGFDIEKKSAKDTAVETVGETVGEDDSDDTPGDDDRKILRKHKWQVAITARETAP